MEKREEYPVIWNNEIEEITRGYARREEQYRCVFCGREYDEGRIYREEEQLYDAGGAVRIHIAKTHGNVVDYLLEQEIGLFGISEIQRQLLQLMAAGKTDREIAADLGIAQSTVRNHRFKLREKEKQAKMYLALMQALEEKTNSNIAVTEDHGVIQELHTSATMVDDRYSITQKDREKTIKTYMDDNGAISQFPSKEKKKIILLTEILKNFKRNTEYTEMEVNRILERIYSDYPTLRRALIEYGFMDRSDDCRVYRVKE